MGTLHALTIEAFANPAITIEALLRGREGLPQTAKLVAAQLAGAMIAYRLAKKNS